MRSRKFLPSAFLLLISFVLFLSTFTAAAQSKSTSPDGVPVAEVPRSTPKNDPTVVKVPPPPVDTSHVIDAPHQQRWMQFGSGSTGLICWAVSRSTSTPPLR